MMPWEAIVSAREALLFNKSKNSSNSEGMLSCAPRVEACVMGCAWFVRPRTALRRGGASATSAPSHRLRVQDRSFLRHSQDM